jgi:hypothetical protein
VQEQSSPSQIRSALIPAEQEVITSVGKEFNVSGLWTGSYKLQANLDEEYFYIKNIAVASSTDGVVVSKVVPVVTIKNGETVPGSLLLFNRERQA